MPKNTIAKMTAAQKRFIKADVLEQVRMALQLARGNVISGLEDGDLRSDSDTTIQRIAELIGHDGPAEGDDDNAFMEKIEQFAAAAYALGIATGLHLRPELFTKGGAR